MQCLQSAFRRRVLERLELAAKAFCCTRGYTSLEYGLRLNKLGEPGAALTVLGDCRNTVYCGRPELVTAMAK
ncbi:hypothetical protein COLU111180_10795 [Cohnella lubricantis]|nr:hypothetical protein [Cohnella lubricantis]